VHAVQLEINRGLYMNEKSLEKTPRFMALERDLLLFAKQLFSETPRLLERRSAAE
jgi:N-formylglutamate amidohydrolase